MGRSTPVALRIVESSHAARIASDSRRLLPQKRPDRWVPRQPHTKPQIEDDDDTRPTKWIKYNGRPQGTGNRLSLFMPETKGD